MDSKNRSGVIGVLTLALIASGLGIYIANVQSQGFEPGGPAKGPKVVKVDGPAPRASELASKLRTAGNFDYKEIPLLDVLEDLRKQQRINIFVDPNPFKNNEAADVPNIAEVHVNVQLNDVSLETALRFILKSANLGFVNQDGVLVITAREKTMVRKVYAVGKLVGEDEAKNVGPLVQAIVMTIEPGNWSFVSPAGVLAPQLPQGGGLQGGVPVPQAPQPLQPGGLGAFGGGGQNQLGFGGGVGALGGGGFAGMFGMMGAQPPGAAPADGGSLVYFPATKTLVVRQFGEVHQEIAELLQKLAEK